MDPCSTVLGILGLYSLCNDILTSLQTFRNFGADYTNMLLNLELVQMSFTRWATAVGINDGVLKSPQDLNVEATENEKRVVELVLASIAQSFQNAKVIRGKLSPQTQRRLQLQSEHLSEQQNLSSLEPLSLSAGDDHSTVSISNRRTPFAFTTRSRQKTTNPLQKLKWVFSTQDELSKLIRDVSGKVNRLIELFPIAQSALRQQASEEVSTLQLQEPQEPQEKAVVKPVNVNDDDPRLVRATDVASGGRHSFINTKITDNGFVHQGDQIAPEAAPGRGTHSYQNTYVSGNAMASQGDRIGMPDLFAIALAKRQESIVGGNNLG